MGSADAAEAELGERVRDAAARGARLTARGAGSRTVWQGMAPNESGETIATGDLVGIVEHAPSELVVTVRTGTPIAELEAALSDAGQELPFDPPRFAAGSTIGGALGTGASGPGRPWTGSMRDAVLGVRLLDGRGRVGRFGGTVMKNVAGYDVARLTAGAEGSLGVALEVSLRLRPVPQAEVTLTRELDLPTALEVVSDLGSRAMPWAGIAWHAGCLHLRLRGMAAAVEAAAQELDGERVENGAFWRDLRDLRGSLALLDAASLEEGASLWRISLPLAAPMLTTLSGEWLIDWGGAQRWLRTTEPAKRVFDTVRAHGGHARRILPEPLRPEIDPVLARINQRVAAALDPSGVFAHADRGQGA